MRQGAFIMNMKRTTTKKHAYTYAHLQEGEINRKELK
jgi:hypothetical protein